MFAEAVLIMPQRCGEFPCCRRWGKARAARACLRSLRTTCIFHCAALRGLCSVAGHEARSSVRCVRSRVCAELMKTLLLCGARFAVYRGNVLVCARAIVLAAGRLSTTGLPAARLVRRRRVRTRFCHECTSAYLLMLWVLAIMILYTLTTRALLYGFALGVACVLTNANSCV